MGKIVKFIVKKVLKKEGIVLCHMCEDAVATQSQNLCAECYDDFVDIQMEQYMNDMRGALQ